MNQLILLLLLWTDFSFANEIALTFDDSPRFATGYLAGPVRAKLLIQGLKEANIPEVAFFSVTSFMDKEGKERIESYARAGHIIANHTHSHPSFNEWDLSRYQEDFAQAHRILSLHRGFQPWFRFPYLREGNTAEKRDGMRRTLAEKNYLNAYITVNNYDWHMESLFQDAIGKNPALDIEKMKRFYVETLMETVRFYDALAHKHLGRSPKHVLLLHETDLNALFVGDLVKALRTNGWKIVSPRAAYADPIARYSTKSIFPGNPGRIGEIAFDHGEKRVNLWPESCDEEYLNREFRKRVLE